jgi:hypothetical protein
MGPVDDYGDEMDALSPEQVEAVLSGRVPGVPAAARAAALVEDLRGALREEPSPEVTRAHLAAVVAAAEESGLTRSTRSHPPVVARRRVGGLAVAATLVIGGGLTAAAIQPELPEEADGGAWESIGPGPEVAEVAEVAEEVSPHGQAVAAVAQDPTLEGCQKGQAVAALASSKATEHRRDDADRPDPCARADRPAGRGNGEEASAFGKATAEQAKADGKAFGERTSTEAHTDGAGFGRETADTASGGRAGGDGSPGGGTPAGAPGGLPGG